MTKLSSESNIQTLKLPRPTKNNPLLLKPDCPQIKKSIQKTRIPSKQGLKSYYNDVYSLSNKLNELTEILNINDIDISPITELYPKKSSIDLSSFECFNM